jgi:hypothetical protein
LQARELSLAVNFMKATVVMINRKEGFVRFGDMVKALHVQIFAPKEKEAAELDAKKSFASRIVDELPEEGEQIVSNPYQSVDGHLVSGWFWSTKDL